MDFWTTESFQQATQGTWLTQPVQPATPITGVSIDSRTISPGHAFLAIRGERHDGHDFLQQAAQAGSALLIVTDVHKAEALFLHRVDHSGSRTESKPIRIGRPAVLVVEDTVAALQALATTYRKSLAARGVRVIAVTGSNGKTTTRHLIYTVLTVWSSAGASAGQGSRAWKGTQSPKSFNNHIGVPLTLLAAKMDDDFVVAELGTNHPGEIAQLAAIARPDVAVITNIGLAHTGTLGDLPGVAKEKASLVKFIQCLAPGGPGLFGDELPESKASTSGGGGEGGTSGGGGVAIVNGDQPLLLEQVQKSLPPHARLITFGQQPGNDVRLTECAATETGLDMTVLFNTDVWERSNQASKAQFNLPLLGQHNAVNALAAIAVGRWFGLQDQAIAQALQAARGCEMRLDVQQVGSPPASLTLINDAYNANPDSMAAALRTLVEYPTPHRHSRRVAILGDMLELGDQAPQLHAQVGQLMAQLNSNNQRTSSGEGHRGSQGYSVDLAIFIGPLSRHAAQAMRAAGQPEGGVRLFEQWDEWVPHQVAKLLEPGDVVLLKASRSMGLERLIPAIKAAFTGQQQASPQARQ